MKINKDQKNRVSNKCSFYLITFSVGNKKKKSQKQVLNNIADIIIITIIIIKSCKMKLIFCNFNKEIQAAHFRSHTHTVKHHNG